MYNGRLAALTPPPIAIYDVAFAEFTLEFAETPQPDSFSSEEFNQASNFLAISEKYYVDEAHRLDALQPLLCNALNRNNVIRETGLTLGSKTLKPNGFNSVSCKQLDKSGATTAIDLFMEGKIFGGSGDAITQGECYFVAVYCSEEVHFYSSITIRV